MRLSNRLSALVAATALIEGPYSFAFWLAAGLGDPAPGTHKSSWPAWIATVAFVSAVWLLIGSLFALATSFRRTANCDRGENAYMSAFLVLRLLVLSAPALSLAFSADWASFGVSELVWVVALIAVPGLLPAVPVALIWRRYRDAGANSMAG